MPARTAEQDAAALRAAHEELVRSGVTSYMDASAFEPELAAVAALSDAGGLLVRPSAAVTITPEQAGGPDAMLAYLDRMRAAYARPDVTVRTAKLFLDGVIEHPTQTAAMLEPYLVPSARRRLGARRRRRADLLPPAGARPRGDGARRGRLAGPRPRDRRPGDALGARRLRGRARAQRRVRAPPHDRPRRGAASRRRRALRRARRARRPAAPVGAARPVHDRAPAAVPRRGALAPALPGDGRWRRRARCCAAAATGRSTRSCRSSRSAAPCCAGRSAVRSRCTPRRRSRCGPRWRCTRATAPSSCTRRRETGRIAPGLAADLAVLDRDLLADPRGGDRGDRRRDDPRRRPRRPPRGLMGAHRRHRRRLRRPGRRVRAGRARARRARARGARPRRRARVVRAARRTGRRGGDRARRGVRPRRLRRAAPAGVRARARARRHGDELLRARAARRGRRRGGDAGGGRGARPRGGGRARARGRGRRRRRWGWRRASPRRCSPASRSPARQGAERLHTSVLEHVAAFAPLPSHRIAGGNQGLALAMAAALGARVRLDSAGAGRRGRWGALHGPHRGGGRRGRARDPHRARPGPARAPRGAPGVEARGARTGWSSATRRSCTCRSRPRRPRAR